MDALTIMWLGRLVPPAVFLLTLWLLLEPKCSPRAARWGGLGFLGAELALQIVIYTLGGGSDLMFTLLPLTLFLPAIVIAHLICRWRFLPTAVGWLLALLCQQLILAVQKIVFLLAGRLGGAAWTVALAALVLLAAGLVIAVWRRVQTPYRDCAQVLQAQWTPLLLLPVMLLMLHSYFLSSTSSVTALLLLLLTALAALWAMVRLMSALVAQRQSQIYLAQMAALRQEHELLQKKLELGRSYRHDERHHMMALSALLQQGDVDAALDYVSDWQGRLTQIESQRWCKNAAVNAVLSAYITQAKQAGCTVEASVSLPAELRVEELDLCVALANALENAIHACQAIPEVGQRRITLELTMTDQRRLTLHVDNSCAEAVELGADGLPAGKREEGHGQGLKSIAAVAKKYHGMFQCDYEDRVFSLWVVLLDAAETPRRIRRAPAVCAVVLLGIFLLNCTPALAETLETIPVLGQVIRVVDLRSYAWFWGDTGVSAQEPVLDGDSQAVEQVERIQEEFISQMQEAFLSHAAQKYQGYVSQDISYSVLRDDDALFILRFDATMSAGGSVEYHRHVVLDKQTGQVLELADLFQADVNYVFPISREIKAQMEAQMNAGEGDYFLPGGIWSDEECFQSIDPAQQDFYINEDGQLVIVFAEYEVAPGSMGAPEFIIPTDLLSGLLTQPSLLQ